MKKLMIVLVVFLISPAFLVSPAWAQDLEKKPNEVSEKISEEALKEKKPLVVDVEVFEPCVIKTKSEDIKTGFYEIGYTGFDIELWEAIAQKLGWKYEYREVEFKDIFTDLEQRKADVGIAGITITEERERKIDFSHSYLDSGLRILVKGEMKKPSIIPLIAKRLFSLEIAKVLGILFLCLFIFGFFLWWAERGMDAIADAFKEGFFDACWCSWAVMTTIGFGDIAPKKFLGRVLTVPIFLFGCIIVGVVSAPIITAFTVRDIEQIESEIKGVEDLKGRVVATESGTTSEDALKRLDAEVATVSQIQEGYGKLLKDEVKAVVYDSPAILYYAQGEGKGKVAVVGQLFDEQKYGFALQPGSELREPINRALLELREKGIYEKIYEKWFGDL